MDTTDCMETSFKHLSKDGKFQVDRKGNTYWTPINDTKKNFKRYDKNDRRPLYDEYLKDENFIKEKMDKGHIVKGKIMMTRNKMVAYVEVPEMNEDILIDGLRA